MPLHIKFHLPKTSTLSLAPTPTPLPHGLIINCHMTQNILLNQYFSSGQWRALKQNKTKLMFEFHAQRFLFNWSGVWLDIRSIKDLKRILLDSYSRTERYHLFSFPPGFPKRLRMSLEPLLWVASDNPLHMFVCNICGLVWICFTLLGIRKVSLCYYYF